MIHQLTLKNCFSHRDRTFQFSRGLTVITGPNESGKSLILEMIRFALFGSAALRGAADDYRKLEAILDFSVQGVGYQARRKGNRAWLFRAGEPLAEGIRPVNAAVRRALGYDMTVFDTANACNQGQIESLGAMSPAQRKHMVDQTVGLSLLESVGLWVGEQARLHEREAAAMARVLVAPEAPERPEGYAPPETLKAMVAALSTEESERAALAGWLAHRLPAPEQPVCPTEETVEALQARVDERHHVLLEHDELARRLASLPEATLTEAQIESAEARWRGWHASVEKRRALTGLSPPEHTEAELEACAAAWVAFDRWQAKSALLARGELECPSCGHTWPQAAEALEGFESVEPVERPEMDRAELDRQRALVAQWARTAELRARYADVEEVKAPPSISEAALRQARLALEAAEQRTRLAEALEALAARLAALPDVEPLLHARQRYELAQAAWVEAQARYTRWLAERDEKAARLEALVEVPAKLAEARERYTRAVVYAREQARFEVEQARYEASMADLAAQQAEAGHWKAGRKALGELRARIKGFLLPSLNTVASRLLSQMTGGVRGDVQVDDQFNIHVDSQPLNTLSGSGKAVANLALRLALGQVLTHRVFPVFLADEVDAAMDRDRAGFTVDALRGLTRSVEQVILVSHKELDSEHVIRL